MLIYSIIYEFNLNFGTYLPIKRIQKNHWHLHSQQLKNQAWLAIPWLWRITPKLPPLDCVQCRLSCQPGQLIHSMAVSPGGGILSRLTCVSVAGTLPTTTQTVPGLMRLCTDRASLRLWECWEIVYLLSPGFKWSWNWVFSGFLSPAYMTLEQWLLACSISRESFQRLQHSKCKNAYMQKDTQKSSGRGHSMSNFHAHLGKEKSYSRVLRGRLRTAHTLVSLWLKSSIASLIYASTLVHITNKS